MKTGKQLSKVYWRCLSLSVVPIALGKLPLRAGVSECPQGAACQRLVLPVHLLSVSAVAYLYSRYSHQGFHAAAKNAPVLPQSSFSISLVGPDLYLFVLFVFLQSSLSPTALNGGTWIHPFSQEAK